MAAEDEMIQTLTAAALILTQIPGEVPVPVELKDAAIEVTLQSTSNHLAAENTSFVGQLLLFGCEGADTLRAVHLLPGSRVVYAFPRGYAQDLLVEVIALDEEGWRNSGAIPLASLESSLDGTLWMQDGSDRSVGWGRGPAGLEHLGPHRDLVPAALRAIHPELTDHTLAAHVPVPVPTEDKKGGKPPVLEKKQLPPV